MTRMLARVHDRDDARQAARGGADVLEMLMAPPEPGVAFDPTSIHAVRAAHAGPLRLRIEDPEHQPGAMEAALACGADEIALPVSAFADAAFLRAGAEAARVPTLVALVLADGEPFVLPATGLAGSVVLDVRPGARLIDRVAMEDLDAFARACRSAGLPFGFAGGLEAPDVARLLLLRPDLLAFDCALRREHRPDAKIDPGAVAAIRALVPRDARAAAAPAVGAGETDVVFVHDFVALLSIGAYQAERGVRQRVRFSVDAQVRRPSVRPSDMAGVFSYDIIIETIRVLAARAHVTFVETLAEELAATLLLHPQLDAVAVTVEKLDVIDGAVGTAIRRDRRSLLPAAEPR